MTGPDGKSDYPNRGAATSASAKSASYLQVVGSGTDYYVLRVYPNNGRNTRLPGSYYSQASANAAMADIMAGKKTQAPWTHPATKRRMKAAAAKRAKEGTS